MALIYLTITMALFVINQKIQKKTKWVFYNPLLMTSIMIITFFYFNPSHFKDYQTNTAILSWMIGPATVALAIPLYEHKSLIKKHFSTLILGCVAAVITHAIILYGCILIFNLDLTSSISLIPKSVTTAIAKDVSASLGGEPNITIPIVILTGILGACLSELLRKVFKVKSDAAHGLALGASAHAVGTSKALEEGEVQGVFSSIALILTGIITVILSPAIHYILITFIH